jgi:hypothetical protein
MSYFRTAYASPATASPCWRHDLRRADVLRKETRMLTILLVAAVVCFFLAAFGIPSSKVNLVGLGLALWALAVTIEKMVI